MGMFDKDKEIGRQLTSVFNFKDEFIVWGVQESGTVKTSLGDARKTVLTVSRVDRPQDYFDVSTLSSAIADKASQAEDREFPAMVELLQVPSQKGNDAVVIQFVRPFENANVIDFVRRARAQEGRAEE